MNITITGARILTPDGFQDNLALHIKDGVIAAL